MGNPILDRNSFIWCIFKYITSSIKLGCNAWHLLPYTEKPLYSGLSYTKLWKHHSAVFGNKCRSDMAQLYRTGHIYDSDFIRVYVICIYVSKPASVGKSKPSRMDICFPPNMSTECPHARLVHMQRNQPSSDNVGWIRDKYWVKQLNISYFNSTWDNHFQISGRERGNLINLLQPHSPCIPFLINSLAPVLKCEWSISLWL